MCIYFPLTYFDHICPRYSNISHKGRRLGKSPPSLPQILLDLDLTNKRITPPVLITQTMGFNTRGEVKQRSNSFFLIRSKPLHEFSHAFRPYLNTLYTNLRPSKFSCPYRDRLENPGIRLDRVGSRRQPRLSSIFDPCPKRCDTGRKRS